jgi:hypothetical protein
MFARKVGVYSSSLVEGSVAVIAIAVYRARSITPADQCAAPSQRGVLPWAQANPGYFSVVKAALLLAISLVERK